MTFSCKWTGSTTTTGSSAWRGWGNGKRDLVVDRTCGLEEIEFEQQQVRKPELLPRNNMHSRGRSRCRKGEPSLEERRAHELTQSSGALMVCETCVKSFGLEDPHRRSARWSGHTRAAGRLRVHGTERRTRADLRGFTRSTLSSWQERSFELTRGRSTTTSFTASWSSSARSAGRGS